MAKAKIESVRPLQVDPLLAIQLQDVGHEAWVEAFGDIWSPDYIRRKFETRSPGSLDRAVENFQIASHIGGLSIATMPGRSGQRFPVGYAMAYNELALDPVHRLTDRLKHPFKHVRVLLGELNVLPEAQGQGIGHGLIQQAYRNFDALKVPSAWVPEEAVAAQGLLLSFGFRLSPENQETTKRQGLGQFGPMIAEYYFAAPSVQAMRDAISGVS